jgi:hypothetical protein
MRPQRARPDAGKAQEPIGAEVVVRMHTALERHESMETITGAKKRYPASALTLFD